MTAGRRPKPLVARAALVVLGGRATTRTVAHRAGLTPREAFQALRRAPGVEKLSGGRCGVPAVWQIVKADAFAAL